MTEQMGCDQMAGKHELVAVCWGQIEVWEEVVVCPKVCVNEISLGRGPRML